jgi:hypothetical protein
MRVVQLWDEAMVERAKELKTNTFDTSIEHFPHYLLSDTFDTEDTPALKREMKELLAVAANEKLGSTLLRVVCLPVCLPACVPAGRSTV